MNRIFKYEEQRLSHLKKKMEVIHYQKTFFSMRNVNGSSSDRGDMK